MKRQSEWNDDAVYQSIFEAAQRYAKKYPCGECKYARYCAEGENCYVDFLEDYAGRMPQKLSKKWRYIEKVIRDKEKRKNVQTI